VSSALENALKEVEAALSDVTDAHVQHHLIEARDWLRAELSCRREKSSCSPTLDDDPVFRLEPVRKGTISMRLVHRKSRPELFASDFEEVGDETEEAENGI